MGSLSSDGDSEGEEIEWRTELQIHRLLIVKYVDYTKLAPALQSAMIIDREDNELIRNHFLHPTSVARASAMVDQLLRKGKENYNKFLNIMGGYYPKVYTKITGLDPPPAPEYLGVDDFQGEVLSFIFAKLSEKKQECADLLKQNEALRHQMRDNLIEIGRLKESTEKFESRQERYERLESDMVELKQVAEHMKSENCKICMRLVNTNDENSKLREQNMLLRLENDKWAVNLRNLENKIRSERSQSVRLRHQLETVPSERDLHDMQNEIEHLKIKVAQSHDKKSNEQDNVDTRIEILQQDLHEAVELYEESSQNLNKVREELNEAETIKNKYIEENERLQLQCCALTDDCKMYKTRSDDVWEQMKEVEKERDQLLRERNEAQLTSQTYMDEKTKYRYKIHQLEDKQEKLSQELREKEKLIKDLKEQAENTKDGTTLDLIQELPSDVDQFSPDNASAASNDSLSMPVRKEQFRARSPVRRRLLKPNQSVTKSRERSLTDLIREDIFHKLAQQDGEVYELNMTGKSFQTQVEFIGGNETGIFFGEVEQGSYADVIGLTPGMKLLKIVMTERSIRELHLRNCTLENVINIFQEIGDSVTISVQYREEEFRQIQERSKNGKCSGDSFYIRANFSLRKEGYLTFEKGTVLHVVHTRSTKSKDWIARIVDANTGEDTNRSGVIPSYRNCISNSQLLKSNQPMSTGMDLTRIFRTMPGSQDFCPSLTAEDINSGSKVLDHFFSKSLLTCTPYTVVKKAPVEKVSYRPCFFLPLSLSTVLSFKLTTMTEPFQFDLPFPESVKCSEEQALRRVLTTEAISCKQISSEMHEFVTVDAIHKIINKKKHCILPYNEKCMSVESFVTMLHLKDIYPIIFYLTAEKERGIKFLLESEQKDIASIYQDIKKDRLMLDKAVPQYATVNLDRCGRLEDAVQQVMELVAEETNKVIWISGKADVQI